MVRQSPRGMHREAFLRTFCRQPVGKASAEGRAIDRAIDNG
ncbi:hypothetical protein HM1_2106 [Heliomicrobium modesticaldum Ice1]|uniref:Uncharacterized protein n=1 Tax=Heliobacterium modesticaldum (strain ATCC 51547 / Ice1) TaxID=498761 RepID=B0TGQ2_HELMI|nr:hypothetical protein HM1_2106 [Heliomicrobium modesticaldum Ice1]